MGKKLTTNEFIEKSKLIHGDKYDYSNVEYISAKDKIKIICKEHGEWLQTPSNHLSGFGCSKCATNTRANNRRKTLNDFINEANEIHSNKFTYPLDQLYVSVHNKLRIICKEHGEFLQTPGSHLSGKGCPNCKNKKQTTESVIKRCIEVHGNDFDYSKINYTKMIDYVEIKCNKCNNWFMQCLDKHINSRHGCPICKESKGEKLIRNWLVKNNIEFITQQEIYLHKLCKNTNLVKIDFVVNYNSIKYFIEYDGKQHYEYDKFYNKNNVENFYKQQRRDLILEEYCKLNNINLIKIKYDVNEHSLVEILNNIKTNEYE